MDTTNNNAAPLRGAASGTPRPYSTKISWNYKNGFDRTKLPCPAKYYAQQGLKLLGGGEWKNSICPFHDDNKPSLRVRLDSGGFRCMVCGAHGGDVLAFHQQRHGLSFKHAAQQLGAWVGGAR
ncbi:MAG: CHC2 zinc finger domain-containing protein [Candidatus Nitrotoga sp.]|nr:CHC2 zinc finger domain-containing protein [Candidatus Nitrotoga sp.]MDP1857000.1 CHC2 zinc finger domain-containing protein [Candidatus Nitrotoga sp.]